MGSRVGVQSGDRRTMSVLKKKPSMKWFVFVMALFLSPPIWGCSAQQPSNGSSAPAVAAINNDKEAVKLYWAAKGYACPECSGDGKHTCRSCNGVDKTKLTCNHCNGIDQGTLTCQHCSGVDLTKLTCQNCNGVDQTSLACASCSGTGNAYGHRCFSCRGTGKRPVCVFCHGSGKRSTCVFCRGSGKRSTCVFCKGLGKQPACLSCHGAAAAGGKCATCEGQGVIEVIEQQFATGDELLSAAGADLATLNLRSEAWKDKPLLIWTAEKHLAAQDGSYFGEIGANAERPKVVFVNGYLRKGGTYIESHYRSLPLGGVSARGPPFRVATGALLNYSALSNYGVSKSVHVNGYVRKDGTYVRPHYRAAPGSGRGRR